MNSFDLFGNPSSKQTVEDNPTYSNPGFHLPVQEMEDVVEEDQRPTPPLTGVFLLVMVCITVLAVQCFRLQVTQGSTNRALAEGNSVRLLTTKADRGLITDIGGTVLAQNNRQLALAINPQTLPAKKADREPVYALLKEKAGIDEKTIALIENTRGQNPEIFPIKTNLSKDESLLYKEWFSSTPGIVIQEVPIRKYANLPSMGQILGYVGQVSEEDLKNGYTRDQLIGKSGLELQYDTVLTGTPGRQKAEVNAFGEVVRTLSTGEESQPQPGETIKLSIDSRLQTIVADALKNELDRRKKKFGEFKDLGASAVVLDPNTGAVKAMVSLPDYDANWFAQGITNTQYKELSENPANPLMNRTIHGQYPSGSVIKPLIAGAALQAGTITDRTSVVTPEAIYIGDFRFPDWKLHGQTNVRKAIAESNNIFFYALGGGWKEKNIKGLGIEGLNEWLGKYGLGSKTGVDLPAEQGGLLPTPEWKEEVVGEPWYIGDTYYASIGQGFTLTTPLQMAASTAAIVNGGTVWKPRLAWSTTSVATGKETLLPSTPITKDFISPENMKIVREGMRQTVESGSARPLNGLKVASAGKTGTAEFGSKGQYHAWYTGFAPYDNPEVVFSILIEGGGDSYQSSVPVAEEILRNYYNDPLQPGQKLNSSTGVNSEFAGER
jgi:penicillin-binding protein 2